MTGLDDRAEIDATVAAFFAVFDNRGGRRSRLGALHELCLPECVIVKGSAQGPTICGLEAFIAPREALLTSGELADFCEEEVRGRTDLFGSVAQRFCEYRKAGVLNGQAFSARGMKMLQFVKLDSGWKISAFAWEDERPGLAMPDPLF